MGDGCTKSFSFSSIITNTTITNTTVLLLYKVSIFLSFSILQPRTINSTARVAGVRCNFSLTEQTRAGAETAAAVA